MHMLSQYKLGSIFPLEVYASTDGQATQPISHVCSVEHFSNELSKGPNKCTIHIIRFYEIIHQCLVLQLTEITERTLFPNISFVCHRFSFRKLGV